MSKFSFILLGSPVLLSLLVIGCHSPEVRDSRVNDRVKACSAGFSESVRASLHASVNKTAISGEGGAELQEETRSIIFSELAEIDRLRGYEDYIACVEKNWNN